MLQILAPHIAACYERAADCRRRADRALDPAMQTDFLDLERGWRHLAASYEFVESLERFLLSTRSGPGGKSRQAEG